MNDFLSALALVMVIEGIVPFLAPKRLKETLIMMLNMKDSTLRGIGLGSMLVGLLLLSLIR